VVTLALVDLGNYGAFLLLLLKPTTAGLVFRTLTGITWCLENSFSLFDLYSGNTRGSR